MRPDVVGATDSGVPSARHEEGPTRSKRSRALGPLRFFASATLLWILLRNVEPAEIIKLLSRAVDNWPFLLTAMAMPGLGIAISAMRWRVLLKTQGVRAPLTELCKANLVGTFYNQIFPSTIGGDVARSYWMSKVAAASRGPGDTAAGATLLNLTVVGVDRLVGMVAIMTTGLVAALVRPSVARQVPGLWIILAIVGAGVIAGLLLPRLPARALGRRMFSIPLFAGARQRAVTVYRALKAYQGQRRPLFVAFALSLSMQLTIISQYWLLSAALGIGLSFWELAILVPIVSSISMIPITINGIGLRENALNTFGVSFGLNPENAVALAWSFLTLKIMYALLGGLIQFLAQARRSA